MIVIDGGDVKLKNFLYKVMSGGGSILIRLKIFYIKWGV